MKNKDNQISVLYKEFSLAEGSQHIASEYAIIKLQELIGKFRFEKILEIGLGIGSISGILLTLNKNLKYSGTEANEFCLSALKNNVYDYERLEVFQDIDEIPDTKLFDLVIIDGKDLSLKKIKPRLSKYGILAIEGDRIDQQELLMEEFPNSKFVHCISVAKNTEYSPFLSDSWQGGIKFIFPNPDFQQYLWWCKEKIKTKIKYQYRGRY